MRILNVTYGIYVIFSLGWMGIGTSFAQNGDNGGYEAVPPPGWATPTPAPTGIPEIPPGFAPIPQDPSMIPSYGAPTVTDPYLESSPFGGFDQFEDEDGGISPFGDSYSSPSPSSPTRREGKSSFKVMDIQEKSECGGWSNSILGSTTFSDRNACLSELNRKVDQGYATIEGLKDQIELFKLQKVIDGKIESRKKAKEFTISFGELEASLERAAREGCRCQP